MGNRIKILHIITNFPVGGAQDNTLLTCQYLDKEQFEVTIAGNLIGDWVDRVISLQNVKVIHLKHLVRHINFLKDFLSFLDIIRVIKKGKFQIVHTHSTKPGVLARIAAYYCKVPLIIHTLHGFSFHDFMSIWKRLFLINIEKMLSVITDKIITVSKLNLAKVVSLRIAPRYKCINIYSGISFKKFDSKTIVIGKLRRELGLDDQIKLIGMVGRLSYQKSPETLINAIPIIVDEFPNTYFVLIGDGELRSYAEKLIEKLNIEEQVTILGFRNDVPSLLMDLDIYVLSSIYEGLGRSLTEAMYCKVPVVATEVEGVPELVKNNETGILVPPLNSVELAYGILFALKNQEKVSAMANSAYQRVLKIFSINKMINDISNLYES